MWKFESIRNSANHCVFTVNVGARGRESCGFEILYATRSRRNCGRNTIRYADKYVFYFLDIIFFGQNKIFLFSIIYY